MPPKSKNDSIERMIGGNLRRHRRKSGLTQKQAAERLSVSTQQMHKYESGENRISASALYILCGIYKVSVPEFFSFLPKAVRSEDEEVNKALNKIFSMFVEIPEGDQEAVMGMVRAFYERSKRHAD